MIKKRKKRESTKSLIRGIESVVEAIVLSLIYYGVWDIFYNEGPTPLFLGKGKYVLMGIYAVLIYLFCKNTDGFRFGDLRRTDLCIAQWISAFITNFITYFQLCLIENVMITPVPMLILTVIQVVVMALFVHLYVYMYRHTYAPRKMVMVYGTDAALALKLKIDSRSDKYNLAKLIPAEEGIEKICTEITNYDAVVINDVTAQERHFKILFRTSDTRLRCAQNNRRYHSRRKGYKPFRYPHFPCQGNGTQHNPEVP